MDRPGAADYDVGKRSGWDSDKDGNVATLPPPTDTGVQPATAAKTAASLLV
jgi:hypothetical protein